MERQDYLPNLLDNERGAPWYLRPFDLADRDTLGWTGLAAGLMLTGMGLGYEDGLSLLFGVTEGLASIYVIRDGR